MQCIDNTVKSVAEWYFKVYGLTTVPLKKKKPLVKWSQWKFGGFDRKTFESLPWDVADGFAVIGGAKTIDGLYFCTIDYDVKELDESIVLRGEKLLTMLPKTRVERSPSGGQHWIYLSKKPYQYIKRYHDCCAIEVLGASWLTIMYPSAGYSVIDDMLPTCICDFDKLISAMSVYDTKSVGTSDVKNSGVLLNVTEYPQCVLDCVHELATTGELDHEQRLFLSTYLLKTVGLMDTLDILKVAKDFKMSKTLYNLQWLQRANYRPCKCDSLIELGVCKHKCSLYPYPLPR